MKRDICCYFERDVVSVYNAFQNAIFTMFNKQCQAVPNLSLQFGLNFSFQYNMNGGACTVRFMPQGSGTAVNVRYSIAQAVGARYNAHCKIMVQKVESLLQTTAMQAQIPADAFVAYEQQILANGSPKPSNALPAAPQIQNVQQAKPAQIAPQPANMPNPQMSVQPVYRHPAPNIQQNSPVPTAKPVQNPAQPQIVNFCSACGNRVTPDSKFCIKCGNKLV